MRVFAENAPTPRFFCAALALTFAFLTLANAGCATYLGAMRLNAADRRFAVGSPSGPQYSQGASQTLRAYGLSEKPSLPQLDSILAKIDANPTPELVYTYVETAYLQARSLELRQPRQAARLYLSSALYAYHYVFNPALNARNDSVFNAQILDVCALYNGACERLLYLTLRESRGGPFPFKCDSLHEYRFADSPSSVFTKVKSCSWRKEELASFKLVADCPPAKVSFDCRRSGLGVPLVARRQSDPLLERPEEEYYPSGLCFPLTAIIRPNPAMPLGPLPPINPDAEFESSDERSASATLELYDPLVAKTADFEGMRITLETDTTTPLYYFLTEESQLNSKKAARGLLDPEELLELIPTESPTRERTLQGLYMLEPYDPRKIPVIMSHGLGSSPSTWLEMYNALRNSTDIRSAYQFWFFFYPTGQPFWASAATLREELKRLRENLDPDHASAAHDQIVLIGHSMGGLISKMQVQTSEDKIWRLISSAPFDEVDFDAETRKNLTSWFFFDADPSIKRVITIATPFEGSDYANSFTEWLANRAISLPQTVTQVLTSVYTDRSRKIADSRLLETTTSIESLSPKCPIFKALDECETPEDVALNNIVGVLPGLANRPFNPKKTDGVVDFWSSHREDADTEREVPATHVDAHIHPAAILEVKGLLSAHLAAARRRSPTLRPPQPVDGFAEAPSELNVQRPFISQPRATYAPVEVAQTPGPAPPASAPQRSLTAQPQYPQTTYQPQYVPNSALESSAGAYPLLDSSPSPQYSTGPSNYLPINQEIPLTPSPTLRY